MSVLTCTCWNEAIDDPAAESEWERTVIRDRVEPGCPVHGPAGRGRRFEEVTCVGDDGRQFVDVGPPRSDDR